MHRMNINSTLTSLLPGLPHFIRTASLPYQAAADVASVLAVEEAPLASEPASESQETTRAVSWLPWFGVCFFLTFRHL